MKYDSVAILFQVSQTVCVETWAGPLGMAAFLARRVPAGQHLEDGKFSIRVCHSEHCGWVEVTGSMTVQSLKDKLKNEAVCNVQRGTLHEKMFLTLSGEQFTDECATLESLGVKPGVELNLI